MARGWESKSVEDQIDSFDRERRTATRPGVSASEAERLRRREALALSRRRVSRELESSTNERYREYLRLSLQALDQEMAKLVP